MADLRLEKLEEAVKQLSQNVAMQEELRQLRERVAMLESQAKLPASEERQSESLAESSESSMAPECCEAGMAGYAKKASKSLREFQDTHTSFTLVESFWDATLFAGLDEVGLAGSFMIFFGVSVSLFLQLLFCYILMRCFTTGDGKYALGYLKDWRILYGHNVDSYDETSGASLVSKICDGNIFDQTFWNNALLSEVNLYLTEVFPQAPGLSGLTVGVVLCSMAVLIWACHISFELQSVGSFGMAICHLPRGNTRVSEDKDGNRRFESISYFRLCAISFVVLSRASIAVILGFSGAWWLCQTRDVTNIMLNAVALLFILEIDDLLYKVLAPKHAMHYLSSIREFHGGSRKTWAGMDLSSIIKLTVLIVTTAMFIRFTIWDNAVKAREARDILCGGNKNFVYGTHPSLGPIFVAETEKYDLNRPPSMMPNMRDLVEDVVFNFGPEDVKDSMWRKDIPGKGKIAVKHVQSVTELKDWLAMTDREAPEETRFGEKSYRGNERLCEDTKWDKNFWEADWVWSTVKVLTDGAATSCEEAKPFCDDKELPLVRLLCPETCGCTRADSGLYADNGCRQQCREESEFAQSRNKTTCNDTAEVSSTMAWKRWWQGFHSANAGVWSEDNPMMSVGNDPASANCSFVTSKDWIRQNFCQSKKVGRPGAMLCPASCCGSEALQADWCPTSCGKDAGS